MLKNTKVISKLKKIKLFKKILKNQINYLSLLIEIKAIRINGCGSTNKKREFFDRNELICRKILILKKLNYINTLKTIIFV